MSNRLFFAQLIEFLQELIRSFSDGYLFFGSAIDIIRYLFDIALVAILFYWIIVFVHQTRAWQLIKGIFSIVVFVLICSLFGLQMINFIFNKLLYVFAILFIVIFQPELRRALETVGIKFFDRFRSVFKSEAENSKDLKLKLVNEICSACREMSKTYTGALILLERETRLDELIGEENVSRFDSEVTSTLLQSIFYKGSPMHDGGLLIRDGRIIAARCHVPLSVNMNSLERTGTRHRAAVGASEIGDTIAIAVSEERGNISLAVNGKLFELRNSRELKANLLYLLDLQDESLVKQDKPNRRTKRNKKNSNNNPEENMINMINPITKESGLEPVDIQIKTKEYSNQMKSRNLSIMDKAIAIALSIVLSLFLWMYVQISNNPVISTTLVVPITYSSVNSLSNVNVSYPIDNVKVTIVGRKDTISSITTNDIIASLDYSKIKETGVAEVPVVISSAENDVYFRVEQQLPETVSVTVYSVSNPQETVDSEEESN